MSETTRVGIGVIGVGAIGRLHAQNLATIIPDAVLTAVADVNLEAASKLAGPPGVTNVFTDYRELIESDEVDAVVIATPPFLKKEVMLAAGKAGKHVFCEKPMTLTMDDADQMVAAVDRSGITFQIGYQRRFDTSYVRVRNAVEKGELGKLLL